MGGKKKTKWRKLPLEQLTQGTAARGSTDLESFREQTEDGLKGNENSIHHHHHHYDNISDERQWKRTVNSGYPSQGPSHFHFPHPMSSSTSQEDENEENAAENVETCDVFLNGFWIPHQDLDHLNNIVINNAIPYEAVYHPHSHQIPVVFCPPVLPYCPSPFVPHMRPPYSTDHFYPDFGVPSDPQYYYYFSRPAPETAEENEPAPEPNKENPTGQVYEQNSDGQPQPESQEVQPEHQEPQPAQPEPICGDDDPNPLVEDAAENFVPYPYPGYSFGEPVYSVPIYPLVNTSPRIVPRTPWVALQRRKRRKRREYNADYAVIPPKTTTPGISSVSAGLGESHAGTTCSNEICDERKGSSTHSTSGTGNYPIAKQTEQNDCLLSKPESEELEFSQTDGKTNINTKSNSLPLAIIHEILKELIEEVVNNIKEEQQTGKRGRNGRTKIRSQTSDPNSQKKHPYSSKDSLKSANNDVPIELEASNLDIVDNKAHREMERKNQALDFPEVHRKAQGDDVHHSDQNSLTEFDQNDMSDDNFVRNANAENLSRNKFAELHSKLQNRFSEVSLVRGAPDGLKRAYTNDTQINDNNVDSHDVFLNDSLGLIVSGHHVIDDAVLHEGSPINTNTPVNQKKSDFEKVYNIGESIIEDKDEYSPPEVKNSVDSLDSMSSNETNRDKQLSDSHSSSPHSFLSFVANSEALIRETELELSKIQHLTSRPPLQANQSIYKFAFDENLTDQSETEEATTPTPSPSKEIPNNDPDFADILSEIGQDVQPRSEIVVHEGDSASEAGSEDVELLPHRYEGQVGDKHLYVNKLSLAVELLRTHEQLPYDDEFKMKVVVDEESDKANSAKLKNDANTSHGTINQAFVGDSSPQIQMENNSPLRLIMKSDNVVSQGESLVTPIRNQQVIEQGRHHRHSHISTADSGVQSEDSGDEIGEEVKESYGRLGFTESEDQEFWNPTDEATTTGYRRFGAEARHRLNIFTPRAAGGLNPCFCCAIM